MTIEDLLDDGKFWDERRADFESIARDIASPSSAESIPFYSGLYLAHLRALIRRDLHLPAAAPLAVEGVAS